MYLNYHMDCFSLLFYMTAFAMFTVLQAIFINGVHDCFKGSKLVDGGGVTKKRVTYQGMVFYGRFIEENKHKAWAKPVYSCVMCMASLWGAVTFWPAAICFFGFSWVEMPLFVADIFILVYLNKFFYNKQ